MGAVVVLMPADPGALAHPIGDPAEQMHVTMCYLGTDTLDADTLDTAKEALAPLATATPAIDAKISGGGILGPDSAVVLYLESAEIVNLYETIEQVLQGIGLSNPDKFPNYIPHLTIGYPEDDLARGEQLLAHALPMVGGSVLLDRLAIMNGDDLHVVALGDAQLAEPETTEDDEQTDETDGETDEVAVVATAGDVQIEAAHPEGQDQHPGRAQPASVDADPAPATFNAARGIFRLISSDDRIALPAGETPSSVVVQLADESRVLRFGPVPAAPAAPPAQAQPPASGEPALKPPIVLVGLAVQDPGQVPHGGRGLPYMSDLPYVALGEVRLRKQDTPDMVAMVVDSLAPIPAEANVKSSLTRSDPLSRAVLMDPQGLVDAYTALKDAVEQSGLKWEDYPFAVQVGDQVPIGDVKKLIGQGIKFGSLIAVMPDGTVLNTAQESQPQAASEEEQEMTDTQSLSIAQRLRLAAEQRRTQMQMQVTSPASHWRVVAASKRTELAELDKLEGQLAALNRRVGKVVEMAAEFPPVAADDSEVETDTGGTVTADVFVVGEDGVEYGPIATLETADLAAAEAALAGVSITIDDPSAVDVSAITAALPEAEVHDDMAGSDIPIGTFQLVVREASAEIEAPAAPAPAFAAAPQIVVDQEADANAKASGRYAQWEGLLVVEGIPSGDGRQIDVDALTWRNLPLPLMIMTRNPVGGDGHDGAELAGRIDAIERHDNGEIYGSGILDLGCDAGREAHRLLTPDEFNQSMIRGVSVDLDDVEMYFEGGDDMYGLVEQGRAPLMSVAKARIMGATLTPFPAFQEAQVVLVSEALAAALSGESCDCDNEGVLVASAGPAFFGCQVRTFLPLPWQAPVLVASGGAVAPVKPPLAWFGCPPVEEIADEPVRVGVDGRIWGLAADSKSCHIGFADRCIMTPVSKVQYRYFANKQTETDEGVLIATGPIMMDTVHPNLRLKASDAQAFYAHTGCAVADVAAYDTPKGMYIAGALRPTATPEQVRALRGSDISPDWRNIAGHLECVALLAVNTSGFITPALAASGAEHAETIENHVQPGKVASFLSFETNEVMALVAAGMKRHSDRPTISANSDIERLAAEFAEFKTIVQPLVDADLARRRTAAANRLHATRHHRELEARHAAARERFTKIRR